MTLTTDTSRTHPTETEQQTATPSKRVGDWFATQTRSAYTHSAQQLRSGSWLNRRQLAPLIPAAEAAAAGVAGDLLAHGPAFSDLGASGMSLALAAGGAAWTYRWFRQAAGEGWWTRIKTGLIAGCGWSAALPLLGADTVGMWSLLGLGTWGFARQWWKQHRPGYPDPTHNGQPSQPSTPAVAEPIPTPEPDVEPASAPEPSGEEEFRRLFGEHIAAPGGALPNAELGDSTHGEVYVDYTLKLVPGRQTISDVRPVLNKLAGGLHTTTDKLVVISSGTSESLGVLRFITHSPIPESGTIDYDGPRVVEDDKGGLHIDLGPHKDGEGSAAFTPYEPGSARSGIVIGPTGSGKTQVMEALGIGLRRIGAKIVYLDPQEGQSSPTLMENADWALPGISDGKSPTGHVEALLDGIERAAAYRSKKLRKLGYSNFFLESELPLLAVMIDEMKDVFELGYGPRIARLARKVRKLGILFICAGHTLNLDTFGGGTEAQEVRTQLAHWNAIALSTSGNSQAGMAQPIGLPDPTLAEHGYGFAKSPYAHRSVPFKWRLVADPAPWYTLYPSDGLDAGTGNAIGYQYTHRHEIAEQRAAELEKELEALESGEFTLDESPELAHAGAPAQSTGTEPTVRRSTLHRAPIIGQPDIAPPAAPASSGIGRAAGELSPRHQQILDLLATHGRQNTQQLADNIGVSPQQIRTDLRGLVDPGVVVQTENRGEYRKAY